MEQSRIVYVEKVIPAELVIEQQIIAAIYSENEDIFRNKERFEVVLSQPSEKFHFNQVKGIYKGRFICGNDRCLQLKRNQNKKQAPKRKISSHSNDSDNDQHPSWMNWWSRQQSTVKPSLKYKDEDVSDSVSLNSGQKSLSSKPAKSKRGAPKNQTEEQPNRSLYENSKWASSLSYVIFNYCVRPAPLEKLLDVYNSPKKQKIEIFIFVELLGQKCQKCMMAYEEGREQQMPGYEFPFFGKTELKRMRKNFSSYIYNKIYGREIKRYRPCELVELVDHKKELCQACQKGTCKKSLSTAVRRRR